MPRHQVAHLVHRCKFQGQCQASWKRTQHRSQTRIAVLNCCLNHISVQDRPNYTSNKNSTANVKATQQHKKTVQQISVSASGKWDDLRFLGVSEHINPASHMHHAVLGKRALPKHNVHSETRNDAQRSLKKVFTAKCTTFRVWLLLLINFFNAAIYNSNRQPSILDPSPAKYLMPWPHVRVHVCNAQRDQVNPRQTDWHKQRNPCPSHVTIKTLCTSLLKVAEQTPFRPFEFKPSHIHSHAANVMCLCATMCNLSWKAAHTRPSTKFHRPWVLLHPLDPQANDVWSMASAKGLQCRCKGLRVTTTQTTLCKYAGCQELQYIDALRIQLCFASKAQKLLACSYGYSTGTGGTGIDNMKILCCALWWGKVV